MKLNDLIREIAKGNYHQGGLVCAKLFTVDPAFFAALQEDCRRMVEDNRPSVVGDKDHITNWVNPYGTAVQFSLFNTSGRFDDFSTDHNLSRLNKKFHYADKYSTLGRFIDTFPQATNIRLNGMGKKSGLSPHDEHIVHKCETTGVLFVRTRFHLPIMTNPDVQMLLSDKIFHFEEGSIYYFNNGAIHSADNQGETYRYHLVWDMLLSQATYDLMFNETKACPDILKRVTGPERYPAPMKIVDTRDYQIQEGRPLRLYKRLQLEKLGVKPHKFQNLYYVVANALPKRIAPAPADVLVTNAAVEN